MIAFLSVLLFAYYYVNHAKYIFDVQLSYKQMNDPKFINKVDSKTTPLFLFAPHFRRLDDQHQDKTPGRVVIDIWEIVRLLRASVVTFAQLDIITDTLSADKCKA